MSYILELFLAEQQLGAETVHYITESCHSEVGRFGTMVFKQRPKLKHMLTDCVSRDAVQLCLADG